MSIDTRILDNIREGLDERQASAMEAVEGPVRIVAGAGAGKTRTITRRIAYACASGAWSEGSTLAVTYTNKAAQEMKTRLATLGVQGVNASTFHSAAMSQLAYAWGTLTHDAIPQITTDTSPYIATALQRVTGLDDYTRAETDQIAQEISWMKVNLIPYGDYERVVHRIAHPIPLDLTAGQMCDVAQEVEKEKMHHNHIDFDDSLLLLSHILEQYEEITDEIRKKMRHITVDEYQDVSPLQHKVLTQWLGQNRDICVVGDAAQTIYSYAGASSYYLLNFDKEFAPLSRDVVLNTDYRSTGNIVGFANCVLAASNDASDYIELVSAKDGGAKVTTTKFDNDFAQAKAIASRIRWHVSRGKEPSDIAILCRTRAKAKLMADICKEQSIAVRLRTERDDNLITPVQHSDFVTVSTIHAAKGLEWDTVFIPDCYEGNLPLLPAAVAQPDSAQEEALSTQIEEERRVFYVALTRGENQVYLTIPEHSQGNTFGVQREVSRFIREAQMMRRRSANK